MKPIPLNDRGQFRYTDLVGYVPQFLQEEPDVVEFLQVMSDYINDAYRNIEDVEEFEFKLCTTEAGINRATKILSRLRTMFELASTRGERVCYLSVPRANVKSNTVFGKSTGYTPYYLDVGLPEITDEIRNISSIDRRVAEMDDGDVVFVRYASLSPIVTRAYYYSRETNSLILDPEWNSQDPFTGTENTGNRLITFSVGELSSIGRRYGGDNSGNSYYEVFFTARVSEVRTESAITKAYFDVDHVDETADAVYIDYYNMEYTPRGQYHATMSFFNADGWKWKDGYPTGVFYLKETSGAKLDSVGIVSDGMTASPADPTSLLDTDRYSLSAPVIIDSTRGTCLFYTETYFPQSEGGTFYLMNRMTGKCVGEFTVVPQDYTEGKFVTEATPVWMDDITDINSRDNLFIMTVPLYFNRGVPDASRSKVRINWKATGGDVDKIDWPRATMERVEQVQGRKMSPVGKSFTMKSDRVYPDGTGASLYIPYDVYSELSADTSVELSCRMKIWDCGHATIAELRPDWYYDGKPGALLTLNGNTPIKEISGEFEVQLYTGCNGSFRVAEDGRAILLRSINLSTDSIVPGESVISYYADDVSGVGTVQEVGQTDTGETYLVLDVALTPGYYDIVVGMPTRELGYASGISDISADGNGWTSGTCASYDGDVFTGGLFRVTDGKHTAYVTVGEGNDGIEVTQYATGRTYSPEDRVYSVADGMIYACVSGFTPGELDTNPASLPYFRTDTQTRRRTPYGSVRNVFMPFYGQVKSMEFGESVDYSGNISVATRPLYITKVVENRLKYGWEHREFMNYGTNMDMTDRSRNGSMEVYSSARSGDTEGLETEYDLVTATIDRMARWSIDYPVVKRGISPTVSVDIDNPVSLLAEPSGSDWVVTLQSAGHGLVDGVLLRVAGFTSVAGFSINGYWTAHVVDGDTISILIPRKPGDPAVSVLNIPVATGRVDYIGDYWMDALSVTPLASDGSPQYLYEAVLENDVVGVRAGDTLTLVDKDADVVSAVTRAEYQVTAVSDGSDTDRAMKIACDSELDTTHEFQVRRTPTDGDYVSVGDNMYRVTGGIWKETDPHDVATPATLYSRQNIATVSTTNPEYAIGDDIRISQILPDGNDSAVVMLKDPIPHFIPANAGVIEGRTMVRLRNVTPGEYNGWHTVTQVISPKSFRMTVRFAPGVAEAGTGVNAGEMYLNEGRWYAYTIQSVDWEKISNRVTYSLDNRISSIESDTDTVVTERAHGLSVGDYVVLGNRDAIVSLDYDNVSSIVGNLACCRVTAVPGSCTVRLENISGAGYSIGNSITRGVLLSDRMDDLGVFNGEYTVSLASIGNRYYRFRNGDIVIAAAQQNPSELMAWRVCADADWQPVRSKRTMKVSELGIHRYYNSDYDLYRPDDLQDYDKYETYSDVDVAGDAGMKYVAGFREVRLAKFAAPSLPDMDTTRNAAAEYSSGEDYSNVAPRYNMKKEFRGVPAMKYPLAEKIERLCYLRDASVIDFDLIEYLARYLGYDITALGDDVNESSIYRTKAERERAVRETIANLPQYYTLGGTKPGLHMLMAAFGIIGEALTLWTDAEHPYRDMIYRDEVVERTEGGDGGKWVPTPYIDLRVTNNAKYPQFAARQSDIERIREQVRVFKPINVVFRDIMLRLVDTEYVTVRASLAGSGVGGNGGAIGLDEEGNVNDLVVEYGDTGLNNCAF